MKKTGRTKTTKSKGKYVTYKGKRYKIGKRYKHYSNPKKYMRISKTRSGATKIISTWIGKANKADRRKKVSPAVKSGYGYKGDTKRRSKK